MLYYTINWYNKGYKTYNTSMAKVLIFSQDIIGKTMAGPGIRYWEFAKSLSANHDVTLAIPNEIDIVSDSFKIVTHKNSSPFKSGVKFDVVVSQSIWPSTVSYLKKNNLKVIIDAYDPVLLEILEMESNKSINYQTRLNKKLWLETALAFQVADAVICASEKQKDLWLGSLMAYGRLTPEVYQQDRSLKNLIDIVPFGLSDAPPKKTGEGFRKKFGIKESDKVILWGGGIWNWFDPLTLIKAMEKIKQKRDDVKLVFMAVKRPYINAKDENAKMANEAIALAKELKLDNKTVFFNFDWVPYEDRANFYMEADIGVSTHFDHLETRFAFRTRMLEYFWANLPIIATRGDTFAEIIEQKNLGRVVEYEDVDSLTSAILDLTSNTNEVSNIKNNIRDISLSYRWSEVVKPLAQLVEELAKTEKLEVSRRAKIARNRLYPYVITDYVRDNGFEALIKKVFKKTLGIR